MDPIPPDKPPGRKVPLWMVLLGAIGALAALAWQLGPGILMSVARGCRVKRQAAAVLADVHELLRPRVAISLDVREGDFVQWRGGAAGLSYTLCIEDAKPAPTDRLAYLTIVDGSRSSVRDRALADLLVQLEAEPAERGDASRLSWQFEETVPALPPEFLRGDAFLHVCCLYYGPAERDTVYTEQVFRFNINRDGLRAMPVPDTAYHRP